MKEYTLSKKAIELLEDNGYRYRKKDRTITIKRPYDYVGPGILFFLFALVALPLFSIYYWLGALIFSLLVVGVYLHRNLISKASTLSINPREGNMEYVDKKGRVKFTFWYIRNLFIKSKFKSEYSSAFKNTSQEFIVTLGIETRSRQFMDLLYLKSDYQEPSEEMNEIHDFFKDIFRPSSYQAP